MCQACHKISHMTSTKHFCPKSQNIFAVQVHIVDGFAGVYPEHKHSIVEALQASGCLVGMTGAALGFAV